jgi:hypothetical protein
MPPKKTGSKAAQPDMKALAAEMMLPLKQGKLVASRDQFHVTVDGRKMVVPPLAVTDAGQLKRLAGKQVAVLVSKRNIVAIGGVTFKPPIIVCYIPAPDIIKAIEPQFRELLLKNYVDKGVITEDQAQRL